jgi:hypothetical protein
MRDFGNPDYDSRVAERAAQRSAEIKQNVSGRVLSFQQVYCDLSTVQASNNARKISIPFRSLFVRDATDSSAVVYFAPNDNAIGNIAEALPLYKNDTFDFEQTMSGGFLWWTAQAGKTMTIFFSTQGAMRPGSQISQLAGGVSISTGSARASNGLGSAGNAASVALSSTAAMILKSDTSRKNATLYFDSDTWIGDASVAVGSRGTFVSAGSTIEDSNTAPLYGIVAVSGNVYGTTES